MFLVPFHHLQMKVVSSENKKFGYFTVAYVGEEKRERNFPNDKGIIDF